MGPLTETNVMHGKNIIFGHDNTAVASVMNEMCLFFLYYALFCNELVYIQFSPSITTPWLSIMQAPWS